MTPNDFQSRFFLAQFGDRRHAPCTFELAVPKVCEPISVELPVASKEPFVPLAQYQTSGDRRLSVRVQFTCLPREMGACDVAELCELAAGAKVVQRRDWPDTDGRQAEIFTEFEEAGRKWIRRLRVVKDGARLFRVDATASEEDFPEVEKDCALSVMSFRLLDPENQSYAEELRECTARTPLPFLFRYPQSWRPREVSGEDCRCMRTLEHTWDEGVRGTVTVEVCRKQEGVPTTRIVRAFARRLKDAGYRLNGAPITPVPPPRGFEAAYVFAPPAAKDGTAICTSAYLAENATSAALVSLVGPSRDTDHWSWAINKRAFEIVRDSLNV